MEIYVSINMDWSDPFPVAGSKKTELKPEWWMNADEWSHLCRGLKVLVFVYLLCFVQQSNASTTALVASGSWNDPSIWSNGIPTASLDSIAFVGHDLTAGGSGNAATLYIGYSDAGTLSIRGSNDCVSSNTAFIGDGVGGKGMVTVTSGMWINSGILTVGFTGSGCLNISGNGIVTSGTLPNSINSGTLMVGYSGGNGSLNISGGKITESHSYIGWGQGSSGNVTITGGTASLPNFWVGNGSLSLSGSGYLATAVTYIGIGGTGSATISGGSWSYLGGLNLGHSGGSGSLLISGGIVFGQYSFI